MLVNKFLKLFTELPLEEIKRLSKLRGADVNDAKIILANEVTKLYRAENATAAAKTASDTFNSKIMSEGLLIKCVS